MLLLYSNLIINIALLAALIRCFLFSRPTGAFYWAPYRCVVKTGFFCSFINRHIIAAFPLAKKKTMKLFYNVGVR